jgi:hypothetical protein
MKAVRKYIVRPFVTGLLVIMPGYPAILLLLKTTNSITRFVKPFAAISRRRSYGKVQSRPEGFQDKLEVTG